MASSPAGQVTSGTAAPSSAADATMPAAGIPQSFAPATPGAGVSSSSLSAKSTSLLTLEAAFEVNPEGLAGPLPLACAVDEEDDDEDDEEDDDDVVAEEDETPAPGAAGANDCGLPAAGIVASAAVEGAAVPEVA